MKTKRSLPPTILQPAIEIVNESKSRPILVTVTVVEVKRPTVLVRATVVQREDKKTLQENANHPPTIVKNNKTHE